MKNRSTKPSASIALAIALVLAVSGAGTMPASAQGCLGNREIQQAVSSGQIKSLDQVLREAGVDSAQSVLSVQVCDQGGGLVYIIGVLSPSGEAQNLVLNAQ